MLSSAFAWICRSATLKKLLWRGLYQLLAMRNPGFDWQFMNYGYLPGPDEPAVPPLTSADEFNRLQIGLYQHLLQSALPAGKSLLEVGSGRGGGLSYIQRYQQPAECVGVDFSPRVIQLCRRKFAGQPLHFQQGDAEALPFENNRFDLVLNVESSHCYPAMEKFLAEAARVLKPGGQFLCADFRDTTELPLLHRQIDVSGLKPISFRDITPRVLAAMDQDTRGKLELIRRGIPAPFRSAFGEFAGVSGSKIFNAFQSGETCYVSFILQKRPANYPEATG